MKKMVFLLVLFLLVCLPITAYAHPGNTDSKGGHYDSDTGDYHYHHGYPKHSHYDMDGDGDVDCPYNFKDKTDHTPSGGSGITHNPASHTEESFDLMEFFESDVSPWAAAIIGMLMVLGLLLHFISEKFASILVALAGVIFFFLMIAYGLVSVISWFL